MKPRSVRIIGGKRGSLVAVPLARDGRQEATLYLDDYNDLISLGVYPNWQLRGGNVGSRGPDNQPVLIGRVLTDARAGQSVRYKDGNRLNLRRDNLYVRDGGFSINHDRGLLLEASAE